MLIDRYILDDRSRPAPRCYTARAMTKGINRSRDDADTTVVIVLGIITCAVAFLIVYNGWSL
jgi:hypothetical protein